jgi:type I site-specific restriction-modification system R (restriction) subunit
VVFLINGIPVCIVEHKNPKSGDAIERAIVQLRRYEVETPELIGTPQLFNVTHLLDYWYGVTWNANRREMARWKQKPEETYRFAVQSFFERTDFLRTLQHWILFYVEGRRTRKSVLRQHQRSAIDKHRRALRGPAKKTRTRLAYPRLRQNVHAAHRRSADTRAEGPLPKRDGDPRRRPHGARRAAQRLGRSAAR